LRVRLSLSRTGGTTLEGAALPAVPDRAVRLAIVDEARVDARDVWLFHKTTRRAPYRRRRDLRPGADDVLLVNAAGRVTESTIANLAVRLDGVWWTPPIEDGLLPGTARAVLLRDRTLHERSISVEEVRSADELALVSSVRGWRPALLVD
jgi:para-aminobenzoate synthetase/4-amino-4-deoxychorismate lyase